MRLRIALALALPSPALAGDVHVVDAGGGDFLEIQPAVDAAADGDVILVEDGTYGSFLIAHKGLSVVADGDDVRVVGGVKVQNTLGHHDVFLSGLEVHGLNHAGVPDVVPLTLSFARGPVRVEDCELIGAKASIDCDFLGCFDCRGSDAVEIEVGLDVAFARCTIQGGDGEWALRGAECNAGGHGIWMAGGSLAVHDCVVLGGHGWDSPMMDELDEGGDGGDGVHGRNAPPVSLTVFVQGSEIVGGEGGDGDLCICEAGAGGDGIHLIGTTSEGFVLDTILGFGQGGCGHNNPPPGKPIRLEGGATATTFTGTKRSLAGPGLLRHGESGAVDFQGRPGDRVLLVQSDGAGYLVNPTYLGVHLLVHPGLQRRYALGVADGAGQVAFGFDADFLPAGLEGTTLYHQAFAVDAVGAGWLTGAWTLTVVDPAF